MIDFLMRTQYMMKQAEYLREHREGCCRALHIPCEGEL
jgi:hypothetical protein